MKKRGVLGHFGGLWVALVLSGSIPSVWADVFYDNTTGEDLIRRFKPGTMEVGGEISTLEVGDEIWFDYKEGFFLTDFSFEFYALSGSPGPPTAASWTPEVKVKFYLNDGEPFHGYATPGTTLFETDWQPIENPTNQATLVYTAGDSLPLEGVFIPPTDNITFSVQFQGMQTGDELGIDVYDPPTVGYSLRDWWEKTMGGEWRLKENATDPDLYPVNFAALFEGHIPEPSAAALLILGGGALFAHRSRVRMVGGRERLDRSR